MALGPCRGLAQQVLGSCDFEVYKKRSTELQQIVEADQNARKDFLTDPKKSLDPKIILEDTKRRMRVGEIFGEGCFKSAADYAAAALVFQHGSTPDHFFQTFIWAKRAVELGDLSQKRLMAQGIDRYLLNSGKKQLFASQAFKFEDVGGCWCLQPVERSFPDSKRIELTGVDLDGSLAFIDRLNLGTSCGKATQCPMSLERVPRGTIPGFW